MHLDRDAATRLEIGNDGSIFKCSYTFEISRVVIKKNKRDICIVNGFFGLVFLRGKHFSRGRSEITSSF